MTEKNKSEITDADLQAAFVGRAAGKEQGQKMSHDKAKDEKRDRIFKIVGGVSLVGGIGCLLVAFLAFGNNRDSLNFPTIPSKGGETTEYSALTGEPLTNGKTKNAPTYCIQTPNGTDGARPQAGLNEAGVVFEAIAEAGITRFAAIYQDPSSAIIGPIRSLRTYYLEWDTPFDCTIVHAGGSSDALAAVANGYKDLSEDYQYMYRGTYGSRLWNNLFTTSNYLKQYSTDHNNGSSNVKGFARLTPEESEQERADKSVTEKLVITEPSNKDTSEVSVPVGSIALRLGGWESFNVIYKYNVENNTYLRSYESGSAHEVYNCPASDLGEKNPEDVCSLAQVAPSVVVAMVVQESKASDNYHEDITTIGSGDVYIFQNGAVTEGTWKKSSKDEQIKFTDEKGNEIKLAPGQTFVTAVPSYGSVDF